MALRKVGQRRDQIRTKRPDRLGKNLLEAYGEGHFASLWIAPLFFLIATSILMLRDEVTRYRPGQWLPSDITSRVSFAFKDPDRLEESRKLAREKARRVYSPTEDVWAKLRLSLLALPKSLAAAKPEELQSPLKEIIDAGSLARFQEYASDARFPAYEDAVDAYIGKIRQADLIVLADADRAADRNYFVTLTGRGDVRTDATFSIGSDADVLATRFASYARDSFAAAIQPKIVKLTLAWLSPNFVLDEQATQQARKVAADLVPPAAAEQLYEANALLIARGEITSKKWQLLRAENEAYRREIGGQWWARLGVAGGVALITVLIAAYVARYQPRVARNRDRALALAGLLLSMLLIAQLAGLGSTPLFVFGVAPTLVVAMIVTIAYDQRFAVGLAVIHAILVTLALHESLNFLLILVSGVVTCGFLLDDIRTRSKLIETGGVAAIAMMACTCASGLMNLDPGRYILMNCLHAGAAGLGVGFIVLGILPFIEKIFRITTSMTLLELADASQPLLRRLSMEAPGTYNHSLQVATLAEECCEAIGADALLARVGAYYHDVGKINKPDYFIENQARDGGSRHLNLTPNVSLLIIVGHVKDGVELAKEYNLPTSLTHFIQQHHGTTLVEYFYDKAVKSSLAAGEGGHVDESQYRYGGPKPKSRETAIVMLADASESACRAIGEPTPAKIETLVGDIAARRLIDGQFDECDMSMADLRKVQATLVKTLLNIYHARIAYPSNRANAEPPAPPQVKLA